MLFSKSKEQPLEAPSASSSASASTSFGSAEPTRPPVDEAEWQAKGAAGLGAISSLSPDCTPLKHRYDACFNLWFKDYLAIGDDQIREQQRQSEVSSSSSSSSSIASSQSSGSKRKSGWFSDSDSSSSPSSSSTSTTPTSLGEHDIERRKKDIMERYERDCGKLFRDYQACVKKAITDRGLDELIREARKENPFPFDHQRQSHSRANNPPFPFPAARD